MGAAGYRTGRGSKNGTGGLSGHFWSEDINVMWDCEYMRDWIAPFPNQVRTGLNRMKGKCF